MKTLRIPYGLTHKKGIYIYIYILAAVLAFCTKSSTVCPPQHAKPEAVPLGRVGSKSVLFNAIIIIY